MANGKVYVASHKKLDIFSIKGQNERLVADRKIALAAIKPESPKGPEEHRLYGTVRKGQADQFGIETRDHKLVDVNSTKARAAERYALAAIGNGVSAAGSYVTRKECCRPKVSIACCGIRRRGWKIGNRLSVVGSAHADSMNREFRP